MMDNKIKENTGLNEIYSDILRRQTKVNLRDLQNFPEEEIIQITKEDYESKFISRYFIKKASDPNYRIVEVGINQFNGFKNSTFFQILELRWKIAGELETLKVGNIKNELGVIEHNTMMLNRADKFFGGIKNKIPSVTQFYKNTY